MPLNSIRARMTAGLTLFVALLTLVGGTLLWWGSWHDAQGRAHRLLESTVSQVRTELQIGHSWDEIAQKVRDQNLTDQNGDVELWRLGANGREVRHVSSHSRPPMPPGEHPIAPPEGHPDAPNADMPPPFPENGIPPLSDPSGWLTMQLPYGSDQIIIGIPWHKMRRALNNQAFALVLLGTLTTLATGIGAWVLVGRTLLPIEKLATQARAQSQGQTGHDLSIVALQSPSSDREVRELVATFNALLDNVARTARVREQFHTSASHELRTPLQALSGTLQLALSRPRTNQEYQTALQDARTQSERLNALTRDLLVLNQLGTQNEASARESVSLAEACDLALSGLQHSLATKHIDLEESLLPTEVYAPPSHVEMLIRNLLENAVKYSPHAGTVRVQVGTIEPQLRIWNPIVTPTGTPEQNGTLSAWFEPFYRPDAARTSHTGGNGLGLAICKAICDANTWKIELAQRDGGIEATVWFGPSQTFQ